MEVKINPYTFIFTYWQMISFFILSFSLGYFISILISLLNPGAFPK